MSALIAPPSPAPPASLLPTGSPALLDDPRSMLIDADGVYYPESEENPMPGNDLGDRVYRYLKDTLEFHFWDQPLVYVGGDNFFYPVRGHPEITFSPDLYVVEGVEKRDRLWFKAFEEPPHRLLFAAEIASPTTVENDTDADKKPATYARHGFEEYFQIDPFGSLLSRQVQGFRLVNGTYAPLPTSPAGGVRSETLGVEFSFASGRLRVVNSRTGHEYLPGVEERLRSEFHRRSAEEERRRAQEERRHAQEESLRADRGDEENTRLRAEIERLRRLMNPGE